MHYIHTCIQKYVTKRRKHWLSMNDIITLLNNAFPCIGVRNSVFVFSDALIMYVRTLPKVLNSFSHVHASHPPFSTDKKWERKWRELCHAHIKAEFAREEKSFATRSEEKNWRENFASLKTCIDFSAMSEEKYSRRISRSDFSRRNLRIWNYSLIPI